MYTDLMLRFPDEAAADALLYTGEGEDQRPLFQNIDVIGVITEGEVPMDGWHVNVRVVLGQEDGEPLVPFCVYPVVPRRVWAGPMYPVAPPVEPVAEPPVALDEIAE